MEFLKYLFNESLDNGETVEIAGSEFSRSRILADLEPETFQLAFSDWLETRKQDGLRKAADVLSAFDNQQRFDQLKRCYKSGGLTPFVGAGLSISSGYPGWTAFLYSICSESHVEEHDLTELLLSGRYEDAAQLLRDDLGEALFCEYIELAFASVREIEGPILFLPELFPDSAVITTNFDNVIERIFAQRSQGFDAVKSGRSLTEVLRIAASGSRILLKIHGECNQVAERVLTKTEYDVAYSDGEAVRDFFNRFLFRGSLLFVGCSLVEDRTIKAMTDVVDSYGSETLPRHYAVLELKDGVDRIERKKELARANIFPIWYAQSEHEEAIEALFWALLES